MLLLNRVRTGHGRPGKSWKLILVSGKSWEIKVNFVRLVTAECQSKENVRLYSARVKINKLSLAQFKRLLLRITIQLPSGLVIM